MFRLYSQTPTGESQFRGRFLDLGNATRTGDELIAAGAISRFSVLDDTGRELVYRQFVLRKALTKQLSIQGDR